MTRMEQKLEAEIASIERKMDVAVKHNRMQNYNTLKKLRMQLKEQLDAIRGINVTQVPRFDTEEIKVTQKYTSSCTED